MVRTIQAASALGGDLGAGPADTSGALAWDLATAWQRLTAETEAVYPMPEQRRTPQDPAYWLTLGGGDVINVGRLSGAAQKPLSRAVSTAERLRVESALRAATGVDAGERLRLYEASQAGFHRAFWKAQPWMDDLDLHWGNSELLVAAGLRYALDLPSATVPRRHAAAEDRPVDAQTWLSLCNIPSVAPTRPVICLYVTVYGGAERPARHRAGPSG
eukprot:SAG22_NODE_184_length_15968_cov_39.081858_11_plen_216_part_00